MVMVLIFLVEMFVVLVIVLGVYFGLRYFLVIKFMMVWWFLCVVERFGWMFFWLKGVSLFVM